GFSGCMRGALGLPQFLLIGALADQGQGGIVGGAAAATARIRAATTASGIEAFRLQQQLNGLGLRADGRRSSFWTRQNARRLVHYLGDGLQEGDFPRE